MEISNHLQTRAFLKGNTDFAQIDQGIGSLVAKESSYHDLILQSGLQRSNLKYACDIQKRKKGHSLSRQGTYYLTISRCLVVTSDCQIGFVSGQRRGSMFCACRVAVF